MSKNTVPGLSRTSRSRVYYPRLVIIRSNTFCDIFHISCRNSPMRFLLLWEIPFLRFSESGLPPLSSPKARRAALRVSSRWAVECDGWCVLPWKPLPESEGWERKQTVSQVSVASSGSLGGVWGANIQCVFPHVKGIFFTMACKNAFVSSDDTNGEAGYQ